MAGELVADANGFIVEQSQTDDETRVGERRREDRAHRQVARVVERIAVNGDVLGRGEGLWAPWRGGATITADDDLMLYLTKKVQ